MGEPGLGKPNANAEPGASDIVWGGPGSGGTAVGEPGLGKPNANAEPGAFDIAGGGPGAGGTVVGEPGLGKPNANAELVIEKVEFMVLVCELESVLAITAGIPFS